jgi:hypothetical protein
MSEQRILNSGLSGDSLGDQVGERVDSIRQRLADPAAVSRIFDAPHVNAGRQQITPRAKDTGGSSSVGQTVKPQMRARFVAAQAHKRSGACPCPRPNSIIGLFQHCISNHIADSTHVHHSIVFRIVRPNCGCLMTGGDDDHDRLIRIASRIDEFKTDHVKRPALF